jgi:iron complex outermembrane recepter protein
VNGVINIITRSSADSQGVYAEAGGGSQLEKFGGARYGGTLAPDVNFRVYGKYFDRDAEEFANGSSANDAWHEGQGGFRIDAPNLSLHGDFYDGHEGVNAGGAAQTSGGNIVGHWTHVFSDRSDMSLQTYYDRTRLVDPIPAYLLGTFELAPAGTLQDDLTTYDIDLQHRFALGDRNRIVWGLGYRFTHDVVENAPALGFFPTNLDQNLFSAFLQDEILLGQDWSFILGSKLEHNDYTGYEVEPNARLEWSFAPNQALWSAISRAARTPSRIDRDISQPAPPALVILAGSGAFGSEYVTAYELGLRGEVAARLTGSISAFYNVYGDVRSTSFTPNTILPLYFANNLEGDTHGLELSGNYQVLADWALHAGYNLLEEHLHVKPGQLDLNHALNETADPQQQASLRSSLNLPWHVQFDTTFRWVDTLHTNDGAVPGTVPSYFEADARLAWHAAKGLVFSLAGRNLLHDHHPEYGFPSPTRVEIERNVYGKVVWRY